MRDFLAFLTVVVVLTFVVVVLTLRPTGHREPIGARDEPQEVAGVVNS